MDWGTVPLSTFSVSARGLRDGTKEQASMDVAYSKHKDCTPEQTIETIKSILDGLGIKTEVNALNHPFYGTYSNHVQIAGTAIGANGKGTTEAYALASGYAELIERIQNGMAATRCYHTRLYQELCRRTSYTLSVGGTADDDCCPA